MERYEFFLFGMTDGFRLQEGERLWQVHCADAECDDYLYFTCEGEPDMERVRDAMRRKFGRRGPGMVEGVDNVTWLTCLEEPLAEYTSDAAECLARFDDCDMRDEFVARANAGGYGGTWEPVEGNDVLERYDLSRFFGPDEHEIAHSRQANGNPIRYIYR